MNRRTLLSSTVPAMGSLGMAVMASPSPAAAHPDADLISLSAEFDAAYARWLVTWKEEGRLAELLLETFYAKHPSIDANWPAYCAMERELGYDVASIANEASCDALNLIVDRIRRVEAKTLAGLAAWSRAARWQDLHAGVWEDTSRSDDRDGAATLALLKVVERLGGEVAA